MYWEFSSGVFLGGCFVRFYVDLCGFKSAYFALSVDLIPQFLYLYVKSRKFFYCVLPRWGRSFILRVGYQVVSIR
jgi:hypothetical protein